MQFRFERIATDGDDFELLCRDLLRSLDISIQSEPARGPDRKKDLLVEARMVDPIGHVETTVYLVQCKHKAQSGRAVLEADLGDWRSACRVHDAGGYFLITDTLASTTVRDNLEAENKSGSLKTMIWDRARLTQAIADSPEAQAIIEKYDLGEPLQGLWASVRRLLHGAHHLPFILQSEVSEDDVLGVTTVWYADPMEDARGAILCCLEQPTENRLDELRASLGLNAEIILVSETADNPDVRTFDGFYSWLQNHRDYWYQKAFWNLVGCCPINPTLVRLIEHGFCNLPYPAQQPTREWLAKILQYEEESDDWLFVWRMAAKAVARTRLHELGVHIVSAIKRARARTGGSELITTTMVAGMAHALGVLDREKRHYLAEMLELFRDRSLAPQARLDLIDYFLVTKSPEVIDELKILNEEHPDERISHHNMTSMSNAGIGVVPNMAHHTVAHIVKSALKQLSAEESLS